MRLGKEELQKLVLGSLLLVVLIYCFFSLLLWPLQKARAANDKRSQELEPLLSSARAQIATARQMEEEAPKFMEIMHQIQALIPEGSPKVWFPEQVINVFKSQNVDKPILRQDSDAVDPDLAGMRKLTWNIDFARSEFMPFARGVCALENSQPLLEVTGLQIEALRDDVSKQHISLTATLLLK